MRTLNLNISEEEYRRYGIDSEKINFDLFIEKIKNVLAKDALKKCQSIAEQNGLNKMAIEEINAEIEAVRNAKGNN